MNESNLEVLFLWHLHQPHYGRPGDEDYHLPWTRLHAVKAYYDMARHLQERPQIRGTFNFSGSLLEQLQQLSTTERRDRWWRWSRIDPEQLDIETRRQMVHHFFSISEERGVAPHPRFAELLERREKAGIDECAEQFQPQDFLDLQVLFNLAWCGHFADIDFPLIADLRSRERDFSIEERDALLDLHLRIVKKVLPLYAELADRGQIEICVSPKYHPIMPLVIDTESAKIATPDRRRPTPYRAPEYAAMQLEEARALADDIFGFRPRGIWPSEGSVSPQAYELFADEDVDWIATDEEILRHSLGAQFHRDHHLWRPWTYGEHDSPKIFFRDRWLSDQVGFVYSANPPEAAAADFLSHLQGIRRSLPDSRGTVAIILDGENPWEHYEDSGFPFLSALYDGLEKSPGLETSTFSDASPEPKNLSHLHSGSWIMGNFQIWIGHEETNQAWEWVRRADELIASKGDVNFDEERLAQARHWLMVAQGSDWFWWYGDDFSSEQDAEFDALFRSFIVEIYTLLGEEPPEELSSPLFSHHFTGDEEQARTTLPRGPIEPTIDGRATHGDQWSQAGQIILTGGHGSMFETFRPLDKILYGFSEDAFFLRLLPGPDLGPDFHFQIDLSHPDSGTSVGYHLRRDSDRFSADQATLAFKDLAEICVPLSDLNAAEDRTIDLVVQVFRDELDVFRFPHHRKFRLSSAD